MKTVVYKWWCEFHYYKEYYFFVKMFENVCRLCLGTGDLLWIFNDRMADNMKEIIEVTSGVALDLKFCTYFRPEVDYALVQIKALLRRASIFGQRAQPIPTSGPQYISKTDPITQMVCSTCCQITIKMYKFRTTSIKNDKDLKTKCAGYNVSQLTNINKETCNTVVVSQSTPQTPQMKKFHLPQKYKFAHPSIKDIIKKYPNLKLPEQLQLNAHYAPYITLLVCEINDWFKEKKLSTSEIEKIKKRAFEPSKTDKELSITSEATVSSPEHIVNLVHKNKRIKLSGGVTIKSISNVKIDLPTSTKSDTENKNISNTLKNSPKSSTSVRSSPDKNVVKTSEPSASDSTTSDTNDKSSNVISTAKNSNVSSSSSSESPKSSVVISTKSNEKLFNKRSVKSSLESETTLSDLLHSDNLNKTKPTDISEITLKSLLNNKEDANKSNDKVESNNTQLSEQDQNKENHNDNDIIEIDDQPIDSCLNDNIQRKTTVNRICNSSVNVENFHLYTSRPFIEERKTKVKVRECSNNELLILSDSDDEVIVTSTSSKSISTTTTSTATTVATITTATTTTTTTSKSADKQKEKNDFIKSLNLTPCSNESNNMPDLSLVSVASKSYTLYTCKVCDSQHHSLKELRIHERKTHTKCAFCNRKFRTLASLEEHRQCCSINNVPIELKRIKLDLVRVDEIEEIRKKYSNAFKILEKDIGDKVANNVPGSSVEVPKVNDVENDSKENSSRKTECDQIIDNTISELEKFLISGPATSTINDTSSGSIDIVENTTKESNQTENKNAESETAVPNDVDIICISDDETGFEESANSDNSRISKPKIKIINNEFLKNINIHDSDVNVLKRILLETKKKREENNMVNALKNNTIVDGNNSRVKIFKNLRKHLQHYKIPIKVKYNDKMKVEYMYTKPSTTKKINDLWDTMTPQDLKVRKPLPVNPPIPSVVSVHSNIVNTNSVDNPNTSCQNGLKLSTPTFQDLPRHGQFQQQLSAIQNNVSNMIRGQINIPSLQQHNQTQNNIVSTSNGLLYTLSSYNNCTSTTTTNASLTLSGTHSINSSATMNNITNIILVPTSLPVLQTNTNTLVLPTAQGPLPVIQSVTSGQKIELDLHTNTKALQSSISDNGQPTIRVKNLSELS